MATINFDETIFLESGLESFTSELAPLNSFARDFSGSTSRKGDAVIVPRVDAVTATTFDSSYETGGGTLNAITVNLNKHKIVNVDLTDVQVSEASPANLERFARQSGKALAKMVLQDVWSIVLTTNFGNAVLTTSAASYSKTQIRAIRKALAEDDVPTDMLTGIFDVDIYDSLLSDLDDADKYGSRAAVADAKIPSLYGIPIIESNIVPLNGISLAGFIAHPDSIAVAMRYLEPQAPQEYLSTARLVDNESGITMGYRRHYNTATGKHFASFECVYGKAVGLSKGLKLVTVP